MPDDRPSGHDPGVDQRWWVETGKATQPAHTDRPATPIDTRFFDIGYKFEQEQAKTRLTDVNVKFLEQTQPAPGDWALLHMVPEERVPEPTLEQVKERIALPAGARGLIIDSGHSARVILTGEPAGERILEFTLGESSSFDCWVDGEWVHEELFRDAEEALTQAPPLVAHYLSVQQPQAV